MTQKSNQSELTNEENYDLSDKNIAKTWISGQSCCTLIISKKLAEKYGLSEPSHVVLEGTSAGILIKKLEI